VAPSVTVVVPVVTDTTVVLVSVTGLVTVSVAVSVAVVVAVAVVVSVTTVVIAPGATPSHEKQNASPRAGMLLMARRHLPVLQAPGAVLGRVHTRLASAAAAKKATTTVVAFILSRKKRVTDNT
jgi:hypothetical protein